MLKIKIETSLLMRKYYSCKEDAWGTNQCIFDTNPHWPASYSKLTLPMTAEPEGQQKADLDVIRCPVTFRKANVEAETALGRNGRSWLSW